MYNCGSISVFMWLGNEKIRQHFPDALDVLQSASLALEPFILQQIIR